MSIEIIGTGYVGLVTGAVFADFGHKVTCLDVDRKKIELLENGKIPFYEPGLEELVRLNRKRLHFTTNYEESIPKSRIIFICVGTPSDENGEHNLTYLFASVKESAKYMADGSLMVIKSTVPIGVENQVTSIIRSNTKSDFEIASCPEFLREGSAVEDCRNPDRIVIGSSSENAVSKLLDLYEPFGGERHVCDIRSAQTIKLAANSLLANKISFANFVADICEKTGADAKQVLLGVGMDKRIGPLFLNAGLGYGGSCFPKDVKELAHLAKELGCDSSILDAVEKINKDRTEIFLKKVREALGGLKGKNISVFGLAFKPNTDDMREAPSIKIINGLLEKGAKVKAYDPIAKETASAIFGDKITYSQDAVSAAEGSDAVLVITEWNEFKELDLAKLKKVMKQPVIIDGRNIYEPNKVKSLGFKYTGMGR